MSFPIGTPPGTVPGAHEVTPRTSEGATDVAPAAGGAFARVYELEEARRRRDVPLPPIAGDRIPTEVWDEVEAASRLFDQLKAEGRHVMFDNDRLTGRVVASLLEPDGEISHLPLTQAVDPRTTGSGPTAPSAQSVAAAYGGRGPATPAA
jgi:hypothetical protein